MILKIERDEHLSNLEKKKKIREKKKDIAFRKLQKKKIYSIFI